MLRFCARHHALRRRRDAGFTLVELLVVVAIIGVLATIALPLYAGVQDKARVAKAQADVRSIASALNAYSIECGALPGAAGSTCVGPAGMDALSTAATNTANNPPTQVGPFFAGAGPQAPSGWTAYAWQIEADGGFRVFTTPLSGDNGGRPVSAP